MISVIGGLLSSIVVLALTVAVARSAPTRLDLDNVAAPIVTAAGDVVTLRRFSSRRSSSVSMGHAAVAALCTWRPWRWSERALGRA